jgi:hypothetical protein
MDTKRSLTALCAGLLAVGLGFLAIGSRPDDLGREFRQKALSSRLGRFQNDLFDSPRLLKPLHGEDGESEHGAKAWLLQPEVFGKLSSGGQRAALWANGLWPKAATAETGRAGLARTLRLGPPQPG